MKKWVHSKRFAAAAATGLIVAAVAAVGAIAATQPGAGSTAGPASPALSTAPEQLPSTDFRATNPSASVVAAAKSLARSDGSVRVIVGLRLRFTPEGQLSAPAAAAQVASIGTARQQLLASLPTSGVKVNRTYDHVPYVALSLSQGALNALLASGRAASLQVDELASPLDSVSTPLVEGEEAKTLGRTGSGRVVAILDTGVDKSHPFLAGKVVSEACYSGNSNCPNGLTSQVGAGAGVPCTYATSGCRHATHVAGIAAGKRYAAMPAPQYDGVAPDAKLISIQVFSRFTGRTVAGPRTPALSRTRATRSRASTACTRCAPRTRSHR